MIFLSVIIATVLDISIQWDIKRNSNKEKRKRFDCLEKESNTVKPSIFGQVERVDACVSLGGKSAVKLQGIYLVCWKTSDCQGC